MALSKKKTLPLPLAHRRVSSASLSTAPSMDPPLDPSLGPSMDNAPANMQPATPRLKRVWLCIYLPDLSLEIFSRFTHDRRPLAITEEKAGRTGVLACNDRATRLGLRAGFTLNAAYALVPDLHTIERDIGGEREALKRLAAWSGQFTPSTSIEPPNALLLEVQGSLRLFNGRDSLGERISSDLHGLGYSAYLRFAPTPLAALWLARAESFGFADVPTDPADVDVLPGCLGKLPVECLQWPEKTLDALHEMGIGTLGDCLRLPRDGFARRFAPVFLQELDRALGRCPDLRQYYDPPVCFTARIELPTEIHEAGFLQYAAQLLLIELGGFLRARQASVCELTFTFCHRNAPDTRCVLGLLNPSHDPQYLLALFTERLESLSLPEPVISLGIRSGALQSTKLSSAGLFPKTEVESEQQGVPRLVERLRARLGVEAVYGICLMPEHRPEVAWCSTEPAVAGKRGKRDETPAVFPRRPLWMFSEPVRLDSGPEQVYFEGSLQIVSGPERIETGWWDGADIARDYFVALDSHGVHLWIYRERLGSRDWFLHGVFG